ncbi:CAP domain-containing protein [Thalassiella azotivora]
MSIWTRSVTAIAAVAVLPALAACGQDPGAARGGTVPSPAAEALRVAEPLAVTAPADAPVPAAAALTSVVPPPAPEPHDAAGTPAVARPGGQQAASRGTARDPLPSTSGRADALASAVDAERTSRGLRALGPSSCALRYAQRWADHVASTGRWAHQDLRPVLDGCAAAVVGENIARGSGDAAQTVSAWMGSPGHRANIVDGAYTHSGMAVAQAPDGRWVAVQVFVGY